MGEKQLQYHLESPVEHQQMDTTEKDVTDCNEWQTEGRRKCAKIAKLRATRITMAPERYVVSETGLTKLQAA